MKKYSLSLWISALLAANCAFASEAELKEQLQKLKEQNETQAAQIQQIQVQTNLLLDQKNKLAAPSETSIGGYGEIHYNSYGKDNSRNQMDLSRFVLFLGHRFDENLSFNGELEWEHAVTSKDDEGEAEVEQAYLNYQFTSHFNLKVGLFLMPFGFLNENHEPPVYFGVERNEVETRIIPSTWREGGVGFYGSTDMGLDWNAGLVTGFDVAKFDDQSKPLASVHQELQFAKAQDMALYAALNYRIPGFNVGAALFSGKSTQGDADYKAAPTTKASLEGINGRLNLGEIHARWQPQAWDFEVLYAKGQIGDADKINDSIQTFNAANPTATQLNTVPAEFYGWLLQSAYKFSVGAKASLAPFLRYEEYNTQSKVTTGQVADPVNRDRVTTAGLSFFPHPQVAFKADYQSYRDHSDNNRFDLGMGYMF